MITARGGFSGLEVVVDVVQMTYSSVSCLITPVVNDVVGEVSGCSSDNLSAEVARNVVDNEVVVECEITLAHHYSKAVQTLFVSAP